MKKLLEIKDLEVKYGSIQALKGVSLNIEEGAIVALLGANGAGKSTLLKSISRIVESSNGDIIFDGETVLKKEADQVAWMKISHCLEGRQIFAELTVLENLTIGGFTLKSKSEKEEAIKESYKMFPVLEERKHQIAGTLSGGEQQMLAIARALIIKPKLLILDEPSLGLAPIIIRNVFDIIKKINESGTTVLIAEQNALQTLKIADYAYMLEVGKITMEGKASDLLADDNLIHAYLGKH
ncbi:MAG: ABC transporter ATP-binding protein [Clostridia bacterium]|nr:ABC transporter ATP-binding protein [Clostridia bacterium]